VDELSGDDSRRWWMLAIEEMFAVSWPIRVFAPSTRARK
jgi:hypothetical protein